MNKTTPARISVLTNRARIGKRFDVSPEGELVKTPNGAFTKGALEVADVPDASALGDLCKKLTSDQALCLGGPKEGQCKANITTRKDASNWSQDGTPPLTRTKDDLGFFLGEGYALLDYDDKDLPDELRRRIMSEGGAAETTYQLYPELRFADRLIRPSSSAGVHLCGQGHEPLGGGFHMLVRLDKAEDAPRVLELVRERSWNEGFGYVAISKSGGMLERFIVDGAVASPERLIFTADPILGSGVCREPSLQHVVGGAPLDKPVLGSNLSWTRERDIAFENARERANEVREAYTADRAQALSTRLGISLATATEQVQATVNGCIIHDDDFIELSTGEDIRVGDLLDEARPGLKLPCADPVEGRTYGRTTATVLWGDDHDCPALISHAHGQTTTYRFARFDFYTTMQKVLKI